jgi:hypothetical protein
MREPTWRYIRRTSSRGFSRGDAVEVHMSVLLPDTQRGWFICKRAVGESGYLEETTGRVIFRGRT